MDLQLFTVPKLGHIQREREVGKGCLGWQTRLAGGGDDDEIISATPTFLRFALHRRHPPFSAVVDSESEISISITSVMFHPYSNSASLPSMADVKIFLKVYSGERMQKRI